MAQPLTDSLSERVDRLERENRFLKRTGFAVLSVAGLGLLMGQAAPKHPVIETQRLVITDAEGKERIVLGAGADQATLLMKNDVGKASATLAVAKDSAGLTIIDEGGKLRVTLGKDLRPAGGAGLWLYDELGTPRYATGVDRKGASVVKYDENGKPTP